MAIAHVVFGRVLTEGRVGSVPVIAAATLASETLTVTGEPAATTIAAAANGVVRVTAGSEAVWASVGSDPDAEADEDARVLVPAGASMDLGCGAGDRVSALLAESL
jgi:antitoxin (DNA-binding transcriptional repressor) of toxin-antitoxin stability system